jgi:hypothetical protein
VFFNQIFDSLLKLSADSDPNVQSAAHLLDRLVKVRLVFLEVRLRGHIVLSLFVEYLYTGLTSFEMYIFILKDFNGCGL